MEHEPAITIGAVLALVNSGLALLVGFGVDVTPEQTALIVGFANSVLAIVFALITRRKVTPVADLLEGH